MTATVAASLPLTAGRNADLGALITFAAQGAGTTNSLRVGTADAAGVAIVIDITAITAGSLTVTLEGYDRVSGKAFPILVSTALAAVGTTVLKVYPGITATANLAASDHAPVSFDVKAVIATGPVTATISAHLLH